MKNRMQFLGRAVVGVALMFAAAGSCCATEWFRIGAMETSYRETNTQDVEIAFNLLLDEILQAYDEASVIKSYKDFDALISDMKRGEVDACMASSLELVDRLEEFHDGYYYAFTNNNSSVNEYYIVTNKKYSAVNELQGKNLALSRNSGVGMMFLDVALLKKVRQNHTSYFSSIVYEPNSHAALVNLVFGKHDAVMVSKNGFEVASQLNPNIVSEVSIVEKSDQYLASFIAISKDFPPDRLERISEMALSLHESAKGRHLLNTFHFDRFIKVSREDMESVLKMRAEYRELMNLHASR